MNCRDVEHSLIEHEKSGAARLPAPVQKHVLTCDRCREFVRSLNPSVEVNAPSPDVLRQLEETLAAGLRPVRPLAPARDFFVAFAAIFIVIVSVAVHRLGASAIAVMRPVQSFAMLGTLSACAGLIVYSLVHQMAAGKPPLDLSEATASCCHRFACAFGGRFISVPAREGLLG